MHVLYVTEGKKNVVNFHRLLWVYGASQHQHGKGENCEANHQRCREALPSMGKLNQHLLNSHIGPCNFLPYYMFVKSKVRCNVLLGPLYTHQRAFEY